jgi:hypothetical protein
MSITYKTNHVYVLLLVTFKEDDKEVNISIPLTINLEHKFPKREVLLYN